MAQYKVPQNVESEDKILGPLSLKQFIYVVIGLLWAALMWAIFRQIIVLAVVFALPVTGFFLLLGFGKREEQSFENYFVALLRFQFVPRKRLWMKDEKLESSIVKGKAKKEEPYQTRDPREVKGQLAKLSFVLDTHGSVKKDQSLQLPESNVVKDIEGRVISPASQNESPQTSVNVPEADLLDLENSDRAASVGQMLSQTENDVKARALAKMRQSAASQTNEVPPQTGGISSPQTGENAILKKVMYNPNLTVAQVANRAKGDQNNQT